MTQTVPDPGLEKLESLRAALNNLESYNLPAETLAALKAVYPHLDRLAEDLADTREQGRLAALYRVLRALGASLDLGEALPQVMDAVIHLTGAERGFLALLDPQSQTWQPSVARNFGTDAGRVEDMGVSRTVIDTVLQSGHGLVTTDAQTDPRFSQHASVLMNALRSILCAPLLASGQIIGAIYVDNRAQVGLFTEDDLHLLEAFAAQAALVIQNARLYTSTDQALAQRVTELETLTQLDRELNAQLDVAHVLELTRNWAMKGAQASQVEVYHLESEHQSEAGAAGEGKADPVSDPIGRQALELCTTQIQVAADSEPSLLAVPIFHAGNPLGVIIARRPEPFGEVEIRFLERLAGRSAAALENARLYEAVQQANQAKTKFISVVTHELRIPMTSIKGYTDLLRQGVVGPVNDMQANFLNVIRNNVERMSTLVSDLSDISRIETGRLKLELNWMSLPGYVEECVNNLKPKLDERNQSLEMALQPDLPKVYADPNRVVQILTNLLSNANKYTPSQGRINITAHQEGNFVRVDVKDSGIGISPEDQAQLFTQFFRSEDAAVREQQGWGLGLSVARRLVELMGGSIGVETALGAGSTFWFTLSTQPVG